VEKNLSPALDTRYDMVYPMSMAPTGLKPVSRNAQKANLDALREIVAKRGATRTAIAAVLGVSQATVSRWLTGHRRPTETHLRLLAKTLRVPYKQIVQRVERTERTGATTST
jgi:DNA-binding transcriptional regulator YiaG